MILVCTTLNTTLGLPWRRIVKALGIDADYALIQGSGLHTASGVIGWSDTTTQRNYLRRYNAVLVYGDYDRLNGGGRAEHNTLAWMNWNNPEDPPVAYLKVGIHSALAASKLPADFPIIRPNLSDLTNTAFRITTGGTLHQHAGIRVRLTRENTELYIPTVMLGETSTDAPGPHWLYRLDTDAHAALCVIGEIIAHTVSEDIAFPSDTICGYRYRKHYLLPIAVRTAGGLNYYSVSGFGYFWFLYALKLLGVPPRYSIPLFLVMDDALTVNGSAGSAGQPTRTQFAHICYETYRYIAEQFYPRTGGAMVCGLFTGGRYSRQPEPTTATHQSHWQLVREGKYYTTPTTLADLEPEAHAKIRQWHQLLINHHYGGLPCTIHDHTIRHRQNRIWSNFTRHSDDNYPNAAPNDVPKGLSTFTVKREQFAGTPPSGARLRQVGNAEYYDIGMPTTGTGETLTDVDMRSPYGARLAFETAVAEMRALGFPDAHGGDNYRLVLSPNFLTGGPAVWRVLKEIGYDMVRCELPLSNQTLSPSEFDLSPAPATGVFEGLYFATSLNWDCGPSTGGTWGLYHTTQASNTATTLNGLDLSGDITGQWSTDPVNTAKRAYRRYLGYATEQMLRGACLGTALPVCHPPAMLSWADPSDPLRPIDWNDPDFHINFLLEIAWNLESVVRVLSPFVQFGDVKDFVAMRNRILDV